MCTETVMMDTAKHQLRQPKKKRVLSWFDEDYKQATETGKDRKMMQYPSEQDRKEYEIERRKIEKVCREKKRRVLEEQTATNRETIFTRKAK